MSRAQQIEARAKAVDGALDRLEAIVVHPTNPRLRDANKRFVCRIFPAADTYCQNKSWHTSAKGLTIAMGHSSAAEAWKAAAVSLKDALQRRGIEITAIAA